MQMIQFRLNVCRVWQEILVLRRLEPIPMGYCLSIGRDLCPETCLHPDHPTFIFQKFQAPTNRAQTPARRRIIPRRSQFPAARHQLINPARTRKKTTRHAKVKNKTDRVEASASRLGFFFARASVDKRGQQEAQRHMYICGSRMLPVS